MGPDTKNIDYSKPIPGVSKPIPGTDGKIIWACDNTNLAFDESTKSGFTGPLVIEEIGYELWEHNKPFKFISSTGIIICIEEGDITDLASIYNIAAAIVPKIGYWSQPASVHDKIFKAHRDGIPFESFTNVKNITFKQANEILLEGCKIKANAYQVPRHKRRHNSIYAAVTAFGIEHWETIEEKIERLKRNTLPEHILDI